MQVFSLQTGPLGTNVYIVSINKKAIIIDCGMDFDRVNSFLEEKGLTPIAVLLTHSHFDHTLVANTFASIGAKIYISKIDGEKVKKGDILSKDFHLPSTAFTPDYYFDEGDEINIEGLTFKVMITPGHTDGSACFLLEDILFSGDTLFFGSIGRTDFPTGSFSEMKKSLDRLKTLPKNLKVYPGHGEKTLLEWEIKNNPYMNL